MPIIFRLSFSSGAEPAKSSKARSVTLMMWFLIKGAPSKAPCSASLMQHSHSKTAQPSKSYLASLLKIPLKST